MTADLYHNRVLELAGNIPQVGRLDAPDASAHKVSRICGSEVTVDLKIDPETGTISEIGVWPKACALGQATTSILAANAVGATPAEIIAARDGLRDMLKTEAPPPEGRFWEVRHLQGVKDYPQRHQSTLLPFEAAVAALESLSEAPEPATVTQ